MLRLLTLRKEWEQDDDDDDEDWTVICWGCVLAFTFSDSHLFNFRPMQDFEVKEMFWCIVSQNRTLAPLYDKQSGQTAV